MKKIIVTGHNGFIGTLLVGLLVEKGYEVVGIDTNYYGTDCSFYPVKSLIKEIIKDTREITRADIEGAYAICHLAALSNDPMGELNPNLTYDINHLASVKIAEMAKKAGVEKFIYSSSCSLYGMAGGESALTEEADFGPITAYAKSKVYSERDILPLGDKDFSVTFLRNSTAYGVSPKLRLDLVVNNLVGWAVTTNKIRIMSDGSPWRPIVHAEDIARAFIAVIETPKEIVNQQSYNVGLNSENYQVRDIANMVQKVIPACDVVFTGEHGSDSRTYKVNFDKIATQLPAFKPKWNLKTGIEQLYESYLRLGMNEEKFNGRYFIRLKQLQYLTAGQKLDKDLCWM
jgi:nucleoside-diphosphate-sugar epimerase